MSCVSIKSDFQNTIYGSVTLMYDFSLCCYLVAIQYGKLSTTINDG